MRVLLLTTHLNIGGVAIYTINLAKALKKQGLEVIVGSSGGELVKILEKENIPYLRLNVKTKFEFNPKLVLTLFKLLAFVKKNNIDIIHSQTRVTQVLGCIAAKIGNIRYVSTCHGFFKEKRLGRKIFGAWGDNAIAISDAVRDHLVKDFRVKKENVFLIYNGVDSEKFSSVINETEKGSFKSTLGIGKFPVIGSVTRLSPVKGLKYLLFAMKDILKVLPDVHLILVGEGPSKEYLMELARKLGIEKSIFFALSTTETERFLSIIDVFIFYSLEEGLGLSLLEAMASGRPCVASNVGGVSSIIEDGVTGLLVSPKDAHALKEAVLRLLGDRKLALTLAESAKALVKKKFSLERMVKEVINVYERPLGQ